MQTSNFDVLVFLPLLSSLSLPLSQLPLGQYTTLGSTCKVEGSVEGSVGRKNVSPRLPPPALQKLEVPRRESDSHSHDPNRRQL
jgi:hypothetical protein